MNVMKLSSSSSVIETMIDHHQMDTKLLEMKEKNDNPVDHHDDDVDNSVNENDDDEIIDESIEMNVNSVHSLAFVNANTTPTTTSTVIINEPSSSSSSSVSDQFITTTTITTDSNQLNNSTSICNTILTQTLFNPLMTIGRKAKEKFLYRLFSNSSIINGDSDGDMVEKN